MTSLELCQDLSDIQDLRAEYLRSLRGPQEAWLEEQVRVRDTALWVIVHARRRIGYCCVDPSKKLLLQFFVGAEFSRFAPEAFSLILEHAGIARAYVTTRDPLALALCLTFQTRIELEAFLFEHRFATDMSLRDVPHSEFRAADRSDAASIREISGDFWGDVESEINKGSLYVLKATTGLLGVGYLSTQYCSDRSANVGMFADPALRRNGIGSVVLQRLVEQCRASGLAPVAACDTENVASRRTLQKAGFVSYDRTLLVSF